MFMRKPYLWEMSHREDFDDSQEAFIQTAMQENLNHARHVENERMSLLVGIAALVAGVLSIGGSMLTQALSDAAEHQGLISYMELATVFLILSVTLVVLVLARRLNTRWNMTFDRHMFYARSSYYLLHRSNFELNDRGLADSEEMVPEDLTVNRHHVTDKQAEEISRLAFQEDFKLETGDGRKAELRSMPLYCFSINKRVDKHNIVDTKSTKRYFDIFYIVLLGIVLLMMAIILVIGVLYAIPGVGGAQ